MSNECGVEDELICRDIRIQIQAVNGNNISEWDIDRQEVVSPGESVTFSVGDCEYRIRFSGIKPANNARYAPNGPQARISVDRRTEDDEWCEIIDDGGVSHYDPGGHNSFDIQFVEYTDQG